MGFGEFGIAFNRLLEMFGSRLGVFIRREAEPPKAEVSLRIIGISLQGLFEIGRR